VEPEPFVDEGLVQRLPLPLAQLYRRAHNAKTPVDRHQAAYYLWEAALKLLGSVAAVVYAAQPKRESPLPSVSLNLAGPSLGHWWEFVRYLVRMLAALGDPGFVAIRDLLLGHSRDDLPRAAALDAALQEALGERSGARGTVVVRELFDRLVHYRNQEVGHGAVGRRAGSYYERMSTLLLAGMAEVLGRVDTLAGRRLLYTMDVRAQPPDRWLLECVELVGEARRRDRPLAIAQADRDPQPRPQRLYLENPGQGAGDQSVMPRAPAAPALVGLQPLLIYDADAEEVLFLNTRRGRNRIDYLSYTSGRVLAPVDIEPDHRALLGDILGLAVDESPADASAAPADEEEPVADVAPTAPARRRVGEFELLSELGRGGLGVVYRAWQPSLQRQVALKCNLVSGDRTFEERFRREIAALGRIEHPHLVKIFGAMSEGDQFYCAMELVEGATLAAVCARLQAASDGPNRVDESAWQEAIARAAAEARTAERPLAVAPTDPDARALGAGEPRSSIGGRPHAARVVELVRQAAEAAHALHEAGLVHRNIKPGNIMVAADGGRAVLMDSGVAQLADEVEGRLTRTAQFVGTVRYASPELLQAAGPVDRRSDVYSLGVTLWELLALRPYIGATGYVPSQELIRQILNREPERPSRWRPGISRDLDAIVLHCLEKDPKHRYATAQELAADLQRCMEGAPVTARPARGLERAWRWARRQPATASLLGLTALLAVAVVVVSVSFAMQAKAMLDLTAREKAYFREELQALRDRIHGLEEDNRALAVGEIDDRLREVHAEAQATRAGIDELRKEAQAYQEQLAQRDARIAEIERGGIGLPWGWVFPALGLAVLAGCLGGTALWSYLRRGAVRREPLERQESSRKGQPEITVLPGVGQAFSSQTVVLHYPAPIAIAYRRFCSRKEPRDRLAHLYETFEATIEYLICLGLSDLCASLARSGKADAALPSHQGLDLIRQPTRMTLGQWARTLKDTCDVLRKHVKDPFVPELPKACGSGSHLIEVVCPRIIEHRNQLAHSKGNIALSPAECEQRVHEDRPRLEQLLQAIQFVCRYPLGFVKTGYTVEDDSRLKRYRVYSCMGARIASGEEVYAMDTATELQPGYLFIAAPDSAALQYLWPFLLQREPPKARHPSLYVFERIADKSQYLASIASAAIDHADVWTQELCPAVAKGADHRWLWEELRRLPAVVKIDPALKLAEGLAQSLVGTLSGEMLGKNRLHGPIARGGFGTIYDAADATGRRVAVKVLEVREGLDTEEDRKQFDRFKQEYKRLKSVGRRHAGIIECYEWGCNILGKREYPWYSMEFAAGGDLKGRLEERRKRLPDRGAVWDDAGLRRQVAEEFRAIADAVTFLHEQHIIHRDIKPANVLIMDGGALRLSDFGLVKKVPGAGAQVSHMTIGPGSTQGALVGTFDYMAPEQARGETVGEMADVYSLGIVLAELATGYWPEPDAGSAAGSPIENDKNRERLDRLPEPLRRFILGCTDREPANRPRNARQVLVEFGHILDALAPKAGKNT
jgi:serine/threonine protein kinase